VIDNTNGEAPEGANNNVKDDVVDSNMTNDRFRETLNSTVRELEVRLERKINELASEINKTRIDLYNEKMIRGENEVRNKSRYNEQSSNLKGFLAKQNDSLKKENDQLKEQISNYKCITNQKVKDLDNERSSLITVIKIL
jgi:hypothetical protein